MEPEPRPARRARADGRLPLALLTFSLCAVIIASVAFAATHTLTISIHGAPLAAATPYPATRPCTLGVLPQDAPATGGIVAALVSSAYRPLVRPTPAGRYSPPPPSAPAVIALCVLRASDGAELAHDTLDGTHLTPYQVGALSVAPDSGAIYIAGSKDATSGSGRVCALRPRPEAVLWCQDLDSYISGPMVVTASAIYLVTWHALYALDAHSGAILWRDGVRVQNYAATLLRLDGGLLVGVTGDDVAVDDRVCAWHAGDGSLAWCANTFEDLSVRGLAAGDGFATLAVNFADGTGLVEQLAENDGRVSWQRRVTESPVQGVADAAGVVYVAPDQCIVADATCHGQVLLLRATTGAPLGAFTVYGQVSALAVAGTAAVYDTPTGIAAMLDPLSPAPAGWSYSPSRAEHVGLLALPPGAVFYQSDQSDQGGAGIGLLSLASGAREWEAGACGDRLAGSAASQPGAGSALVWCHWPPGTRMSLVAIQGGAA